ncbi:cytochrome-c peroxidase [Pleionea sediminis]|uniref:cytochrome-c peroxidase n=1 Tax=Pleionea sediminis TaxID=2569479 RepID=UPI001186B13B|nr:cytochrome c peroxidase [Pleionea sediminis]
MIRSSFTLIVYALIHPYVTAGQPLGTPDPDYIEYPYGEPPSEAEVELGKKLFFDPRLSVNESQSCATCHNPDLGFSDGVKFSFGANGKKLERHTPHLYNLAWNVIFAWDGRDMTLEEQALGPIESKAEMGMSLTILPQRLGSIPGYKKLFKEVYNSEEITAELVTQAIAAFERTIISNNSPFDKYIAGDKNAMSPAAIRGLELFKGKARCTECHDGENFTDNSFHNLGIKGDDPGRAKIINDDSLFGAFKTPGLRNIALSPPYMHDGSKATLEEVMEFYNRGGDGAKNTSNVIKPLNLTKQEIYDLVAFMGALTDPVIIERPSLP